MSTVLPAFLFGWRALPSVPTGVAVLAKMPEAMVQTV